MQGKGWDREGILAYNKHFEAVFKDRRGDSKNIFDTRFTEFCLKMETQRRKKTKKVQKEKEVDEDDDIRANEMAIMENSTKPVSTQDAVASLSQGDDIDQIVFDTIPQEINF